MKKHIELLIAFAEFEAKRPEATLDDFYTYMLYESKASFKKAAKPTESHNRLMRSIGRLFSAFNLYMRVALKEAGMTIPEGYPFLAALHFNGEMRRTDLINLVLVELSTGSQILNRLKKQGWITEKQDTADKRVKNVSISEKGKMALFPCLEKASLLREFMFRNLSEADKKTCAAILEPAEAFHSKLVMSVKTKSIDEITGLNKTHSNG